MSLSCEICGRRKAVYVCQKCGRKVCESCIDPTSLTCINCNKTYLVETYPTLTGLSLFSKLLILGLIIVFVGLGIIFLSALINVKITPATGFIWIFPFPPIFVGSGLNDPLAWITFTFMAVFLGFFLFSLLKILKT